MCSHCTDKLRNWKFIDSYLCCWQSIIHLCKKLYVLTADYNIKPNFPLLTDAYVTGICVLAYASSFFSDWWQSPLSMFFKSSYDLDIAIHLVHHSLLLHIAAACGIRFFKIMTVRVFAVIKKASRLPYCYMNKWIKWFKGIYPKHSFYSMW